MSTANRDLSGRLDALEERLDDFEARLKAILRMEQAILQHFEQELEEETHDVITHGVPPLPGRVSRVRKFTAQEAAAFSARLNRVEEEIAAHRDEIAVLKKEKAALEGEGRA
jgi:predicted  nucleic acid-binding Zn-ribbon protein